MEKDDKKSTDSGVDQQPKSGEVQGGEAPLNRVASGSNPTNQSHAEAKPRKRGISPGWQKFGIISQATFSAFLVGVGLLQVWVYTRQKEIMDNQLQIMASGQRAWIAPTSAGSDQPKLGTELKLSIVFINTGREPAMKVAYASEAFVSTESPDNPEKLKKAIDDYVAICKVGKDEMLRVGVVYPTSGHSAYSVHPAFPGRLVDDGAIDGTKLLAVAGCFSYEAQGSVHHSTFCFDWSAKAGNPNTWFFCGTGNDAD